MTACAPGRSGACFTSTSTGSACANAFSADGSCAGGSSAKFRRIAFARERKQARSWRRRIGRESRIRILGRLHEEHQQQAEAARCRRRCAEPPAQSNVVITFCRPRIVAHRSANHQPRELVPHKHRARRRNRPSGFVFLRNRNSYFAMCDAAALPAAAVRPAGRQCPLPHATFACEITGGFIQKSWLLNSFARSCWLGGLR